MSRLVSLAILLCICAASLPAQEDVGSILGRVSDNTGSVVVGAAIRVVHIETGVELKTVTNEAGNYLMVSLRPGTYRLTADAAGFKRVEVPEVIVSIQAKARVDLTLEVGAVHESVSVVSAAAELVTDDTTVGQVVDSKTVVELPLLNRNVADLALLGPGVTNGSNSSINGIVSALFTGSVAVAANGMRPSANQYSIDGGNVNIGFYNYPTMLPMPEAIGESKVRTADYSAEYGGFGGAQIDYSLRSGTNRFHGGLFEFISNDKLNARNAFALTAKPIYKQNQFGGILNGPIIKNKSFFMLSYQGMIRREQNVIRTNVPTLAQRNGDLRVDILGRNVAAFRDPQTGQPFPGNQIPAARISPTMARFLKLWPEPNLVGSNNYTTLVRVPTDNHMVLAKFDQMIGQDHVSVHYSINKIELLSTQPAIGDFGLTGNNRGQNAGISAAHIFTPATIIDLRLSYNRHFLYNKSPRNGSDYDARKELLIEIPSSTGPGTIENGIPSVSSQSFATVGDIPNGSPLIQPDEVYQAASGLTSVHGKHSLKFGTDIRHTRSSRFRTLNNAGIMAFNGSNPAGTGYDVADLLLGLPNTSGMVTNPITVDLRQWRTDFYALDNWNISPKVTLNVGVRYEFNFPLTEPGGRIPFFDMTAPGGFVQQPKGEQLFKANYLNFAPRVGLAYRFTRRSVFRAAYGIFYSGPKLLSFSNAAQNPPLVTQYSFSSSLAAPLNASRPFPVGVLVSGGVPAPVALERDASTPYVQTWSTNIQQAIGKSMVAEIGYVGNHAIKMIRTMNLNVPPPGAGAIQPRRPLPNWGAIQYQQGDAMSNYHGLQTRLQRRFAAGISLIASYTFSRAIDLSADEQEGTTIDPSNLNRDRGLSDFQQKHRLSITYVFQLPFGRGKKWASSGAPAQILGGWQLSGVTQYNTGTPLSVTTSATPANSGLGISRPNRLCDGNLDGGGNRAAWINTSCFVVPANFTIGNSGRNIIIGPNYRNWNVGISRTFRLYESHSLFFRAEGFNALNNTNLGTPALSLGSANFGQINNSRDARRIQMALKYNF